MGFETPPHHHWSCQNFIFFHVCHFDQILSPKEKKKKIHQTDPSPHAKHVVYDDGSLELAAGECQEFGVLRLRLSVL